MIFILNTMKKYIINKIYTEFKKNDFWFAYKDIDENDTSEDIVNITDKNDTADIIYKFYKLLKDNGF